MADPKTPPQGYDRYCDQCRQPYTFSNAKAVRTLNWRRFCSPGCERGETFRRTAGVWVGDGEGVGGKPPMTGEEK